ncbi:MAG: methyltransferase domain-containing protein [Candidatus Sabulitectum sp.]|nr:methyltransferase domain-containing protein [Candidatus Sabulitectum sp.]
MSKRENRVCPVENTAGLDNKFRRLLHNPRKILLPYIQQGMTALDVGCGPGFFSIDMAKLVGNNGRVIAADLQQGMLDKVEAKITGTALENRIILHKCSENRIGVTETVDFVLLFYMAHEVQKKSEFFKEIEEILNPAGRILIVEPPFHVSRSAFEETVNTAIAAGFTQAAGPRIPLNKTVILRKS